MSIFPYWLTLFVRFSSSSRSKCGASPGSTLCTDAECTRGLSKVMQGYLERTFVYRNIHKSLAQSDKSRPWSRLISGSIWCAVGGSGSKCLANAQLIGKTYYVTKTEPAELHTLLGWGSEGKGQSFGHGQKVSLAVLRTGREGSHPSHQRLRTLSTR